MTKELWSMTTPANLDSFLDSYSSSDESTSAPHRTVDEILNASDSSSRSNSPPSSPPSFRRYDRSSDLHKSDQFSPPGSRQDHAVEHESAVSNSSPFTRVLDQFRASSSSSSNSKSSKRLPLLFGGVRSNAKPGAAFAAAVAASRSVPTPHADIIKSKRAISLSSGTLQKVLDGSESISSGFEDQGISSSNGDSVDLGINIFEDGYRTGDFQSSNQEVPQSDDIESVGKQIKGFVSNDKLVEGVVSDDKEPELEETMASDVAGELLDNGDSKSNAERESVDLSASSLTYLVDGFTQEEGPAKFDTGNITSETAESQDAAPDTTKEVSLSRKSDYSEESSIHSPEFDKKKNNEASITTEESAGYNLDKVVPTSSNDPAGVDCAGDGEDGSWMGDISELVEERIEQLENERKSREKEKKSLAFRKPLILAEEFEKKQAYTGLHWEEGAAAQPMRLEGVKRGSTTLGYFDVDSENLITRTVSSQTFRRDHGSPQVLAVHLNYVAVGMSKGVIVVVPSKYSANSADQMDHKIIWLGLQGDRSLSPVTSMCFNPQGDLLLAGYGDGHVTVWDVQKASAAKVITGEHTAPVLHTLFLGRDSQGSRQFKAITGDSKGLVFLHTFSAVLLLNMYSVKTQCLLDGQKNGTVLSASPLLLDESCGSPLPSSQCGTVASSGGLGSMMGGVVGGEAGWKLFNENTSVVDEGVVIFVTYQTALVV